MSAECFILLANRQRRVALDLAWLRRAAQWALDCCHELRGPGAGVLKRLPAVEVAIVSDRTIARVHRDFMRIAGATDVITFDHGEIVASAETAARCAREHGHFVEAELALYIIHGLLHLAGHDDRTPRAAAAMRRVQERLWRDCLRALA